MEADTRQPGIVEQISQGVTLDLGGIKMPIDNPATPSRQEVPIPKNVLDNFGDFLSMLSTLLAAEKQEADTNICAALATIETKYLSPTAATVSRDSLFSAYYALSRTIEQIPPQQLSAYPKVRVRVWTMLQTLVERSIAVYQPETERPKLDRIAKNFTDITLLFRLVEYTLQTEANPEQLNYLIRNIVYTDEQWELLQVVAGIDRALTQPNKLPEITTHLLLRQAVDSRKITDLKTRLASVPDDTANRPQELCNRLKTIVAGIAGRTSEATATPVHERRQDDHTSGIFIEQNLVPKVKEALGDNSPQTRELVSLLKKCTLQEAQAINNDSGFVTSLARAKESIASAPKDARNHVRELLGKYCDPDVAGIEQDTREAFSQIKVVYVLLSLANQLKDVLPEPEYVGVVNQILDIDMPPPEQSRAAEQTETQRRRAQIEQVAQSLAVVVDIWIEQNGRRQSLGQIFPDSGAEWTKSYRDRCARHIGNLSVAMVKEGILNQPGLEKDMSFVLKLYEILQEAFRAMKHQESVQELREILQRWRADNTHEILFRIQQMLGLMVNNFFDKQVASLLFDVEDVDKLRKKLFVQFREGIKDYDIVTCINLCAELTIFGVLSKQTQRTIREDPIRLVSNGALRNFQAMLGSTPREIFLAPSPSGDVSSNVLSEIEDLVSDPTETPVKESIMELPPDALEPLGLEPDDLARVEASLPIEETVVPESIRKLRKFPANANRYTTLMLAMETHYGKILNKLQLKNGKQREAALKVLNQKRQNATAVSELATALNIEEQIVLHALIPSEIAPILEQAGIKKPSDITQILDILEKQNTLGTVKATEISSAIQKIERRLALQIVYPATMQEIERLGISNFEQALTILEDPQYVLVNQKTATLHKAAKELGLDPSKFLKGYIEPSDFSALARSYYTDTGTKIVIMQGEAVKGNGRDTGVYPIGRIAALQEGGTSGNNRAIANFNMYASVPADGQESVVGTLVQQHAQSILSPTNDNLLIVLMSISECLFSGEQDTYETSTLPCEPIHSLTLPPLPAAATTQPKIIGDLSMHIALSQVDAETRTQYARSVRDTLIESGRMLYKSSLLRNPPNNRWAIFNIILQQHLFAPLFSLNKARKLNQEPDPNQLGQLVYLYNYAVGILNDYVRQTSLVRELPQAA